MTRERVVVAGAGAAGLSVAAMLKRQGIDPLVLERTGQVGSSWRSRYHSLRLNTPRITSTLAGYRMPRRYGRWPGRDQVVEYLEEYARRHRLRLQFHTEVRRVERAGGLWRLATSAGEIDTAFAVIATGHDAEPKLPDWPGRHGFTGELIHASAYRSAEPFAGRSVLVISARNTGSEIAHELAASGCRVWTSMRTAPSVVPREWPRGLPLNYATVLMDPLPDFFVDQGGYLFQRLIYGNLARYGIPRAPIGAQSATKKRHVSALVDSGFIEDVKHGRVKLVPNVERFEASEVVLVDGARLSPDVVIAATGYQRNLPSIVGHLGVLDGFGLPALHGRPLRWRAHPRAPRLHFNGYYTTAAGQLRFMRIDGRRVAREIARQLPG
ncbi:MAG TPA: NAD(P)/FAD-dependent oxidoreductase [Thermoleophilaceae bacterium]